MTSDDDVTVGQRRKMMACLDLTCLDPATSSKDVAALIDRSTSRMGPVAALCIPPEFVRQVVGALSDTPVRTATVVGFPYPTETPDEVANKVVELRALGVDEIDMVIPWKLANTDNMAPVREMVSAIRKATGDGCLKVILESGELEEAALAKAASEALAAGADFLKTSTGTTTVGATLRAVDIMGEQIAAYGKQTDRQAGLKVSGGIRTAQQAWTFLERAEYWMGHLGPDRFRIGASGLYDALLEEGQEKPLSSGY